MTQSIKKGFTLIEMLIVIVIIGILAGVLLPKIGGARDKAQDVAVKTMVKNLGSAALQYEMDNNNLPSSIDDINDEKYGVTIGDDDVGKYTIITGSNHHFLICGTLSDDSQEGQFSEMPTSYDSTGEAGNIYCYKS